MKSVTRHAGPAMRRRRGSAMLDYVLVLGAVLPMVAMSYYYSVRIMRLVYEMTCALVCWPFM